MLSSEVLSPYMPLIPGSIQCILLRNAVPNIGIVANILAILNAIGNV